MKMKFFRAAALLTAALLALALLVGCNAPTDTSAPNSVPTSGTSAPVRESVRINGIVGPTGVGLVNLMKAQADGTTQHDYTVNFVTAPDAIVGKITSGDIDIAAVPTNLAATLYQRTSGKVKMIAINTLGVLSILENGNTIESVEDLRGKTIYSTGQGSNPEYILRYVLTENGIDPDTDVTLQFVTENEELAQLLVKGTAQVALVPEPLATTVMGKNPSLRKALDMTDEWNAVADGASPMMGCLIVRTAFLEEHEETVKAFLAEYQASVQKAIDDVDGTAALCETYGVIASTAIAQKALPNCHLTYVAGAEMQAAIAGYFQVLYDANPKALGGAMPDEGFYYAG